MKTASKTLIAIAVLAASLGASFTSAAPLRHPTPSVVARTDLRLSTDFRDRLQNMRSRIATAERTRQLSHREATRLTAKVNELERLKHSYERSGRGINAREAASLNAQADVILAQIRTQAHDNNRR